jgi:hypothetical protein
MGENAAAKGSNALAIGHFASALGTNAIAIGGAIAADNTIAIGDNTIVPYKAVTLLGHATVDSEKITHTSLTTGTVSISGSGICVDADGFEYTRLGGGILAMGNGFCEAVGRMSIAIGCGT